MKEGEDLCHSHICSYVTLMLYHLNCNYQQPRWKNHSPQPQTYNPESGEPVVDCEDYLKNTIMFGKCQ